ncbi:MULTISPECIES: CRISPR-associated protein Csx3 [unclassified Anabaena]|uniref:CRISPR-associated protein Csx3 n=1 Tax=unclassified Anabaena TaxID=2619674 RepID=UPI0039C6F8F7
MTAYHIALENDVLKVKFGEPAHGNQIIQDAATRLDHMLAAGELSGGKLLKIDGPASVAVSYLIAHKISHLYGAIAIFDPKIGQPGYKAYIVAATHTPAYKLGEIIETDEPYKSKPIIKVVLGGPPQSGKSCLREGLKQAITNIAGAPYPYVITACPDGEGAWFSEAARRDPDLARRLKDEYKAKFTPEFAIKAAGWVRSANTPLNIIDVGGKITEENRVIVREATHAVILSGDRGKDEVPLWEKFCRDLNIPIIANLDSDYQGTEDKIFTRSPLLTGSVHLLERGEDISSRPMVQALAQLLVGLCKRE